MLHFLLRMVAVPATIFQLILRQPVNGSSNPRVIRVAELDQSPNHISCETRLVPSLAFLDLARAGERAGLCLVKLEKSLAFRTDPMIGRSVHLLREVLEARRLMSILDDNRSPWETRYLCLSV